MVGLVKSPGDLTDLTIALAACLPSELPERPSNSFDEVRHLVVKQSGLVLHPLNKLVEFCAEKPRLVVKTSSYFFELGIEKASLIFNAFVDLQEPLPDKLRLIVERLIPELGIEKIGLIFDTLDQLQEALIDKLRLIVEPLIAKFGIEKLRIRNF